MRCAKILLLGWLLAFLPFGLLAATDSLVWHTASNRVSADIRGEALFPLLKQIAHQTGWQIFVEPGTDRKADVKFTNLPPGEALKKLLGDLNFAFVPMTNEASELYVFLISQENATRPVAPEAAKPVKRKPNHVANELLVKVKPGTDIDALAKSLGAKVIGRDDKLGIYRLQFDDAAATDAALAQLKTNAAVESVDYNYLYDAPLAAKPMTSSATGPVSLTLDSSKPGDPCQPVVGLIDTGIQSMGSALDSFVLKSVSVADQAAATAATTGPTHATAMAETILRAISQQGGSSAVKILPVDVYGSSETATTWNVALGVKAAVDGGATVLNMSLGGTGDSAVLDSIIQQALAKGVIIFAAAGNQPTDAATYPAAIPGVNAVTALGAPGQLAAYANYGSFVDMALPGASVIYLGNQAYVVQGTSPATAFASGVAAGYRGVNCDSWAQIQALMQQKFTVPAK